MSKEESAHNHEETACYFVSLTVFYEQWRDAPRPCNALFLAFVARLTFGVSPLWTTYFQWQAAALEWSGTLSVRGFGPELDRPPNKFTCPTSRQHTTARLCTLAKVSVTNFKIHFKRRRSWRKRCSWGEFCLKSAYSSAACRRVFLLL